MSHESFLALRGRSARRLGAAAAVVIWAFLALPGCGDQVQKVKAPERPGATGMPAGHPELGGADPHAAADPFADSAHGQPAMAAGKSDDPERVVLAGEIAVDPAVTVGASYVVYVLGVYGREEKAPVLVKKYDSPKFPFRFELKEKDSGMGARQSDRPLYLRAMISDTGDVMKSRNRTTSEQAYPLFTKDVKLTIKP
jgi:hypothetical protein